MGMHMAQPLRGEGFHGLSTLMVSTPSNGPGWLCGQARVHAYSDESIEISELKYRGYHRLNMESQGPLDFRSANPCCRGIIIVQRLAGNRNQDLITDDLLASSMTLPGNMLCSC